MPTSSENGSLAASGVGEEASDGLPSRPAGSSLRVPAGQTVAGSKQAGTADAREVDAAPARTDIAFDSGDAQYQTAEQIEIPDFGKIAGPAGSISLWLQPGWQEGNQDDATLIELGDGRLQLSKNVTFLRFEFIDDGGNDGGVGAPIGEWQQGEWHQVTATWNGNQYALYLDGQPVSQTVHDGRVDLPPDARLYIGSNYPDSRPVASATIGRVDLRNHPLGPGEVASNYNAVAGRSVSARTGR